MKIAGNRINHHKGKDHPKWLGDKVGYCGLHQWVRREKGNPTTCEFCGCSDKKCVWANKSRAYKRDLEDWMALCVSCHYYYDEVDLKRWKDHVYNHEKICVSPSCEREVKARGLCSRHYNIMNLKERGLL